MLFIWLGYTVLTFDGIPCDDSSLYGYIFIDIIGLTHNVAENAPHFEIGNFEIEFSRDEIFIPSSSEQTRPRFKNDEDRVSSREYTATNNNGTGDNWDADCIFASDNNMDYGYGLLINPDGTFMDKARYGNDLSDPSQHNKLEHPEQHLANRVATYWMKSRRQVTTELRTDAIPAITPHYRITLDGTIFNPTAISHDWRDDITILTLLESEEEQ